MLHDYLEKPEDFLWTILVGNTLANFLILGWSLAWLHQGWRASRVVWRPAFVVVVFLFYTFFDLLPKMLFRALSQPAVPVVAGPFRFIHLALRPLVALVEAVRAGLLHWTGREALTGQLFGNREEMRVVMQEAAPGVHRRGARDDQPGAGPAKLDRAQIAVPLAKVTGGGGRQTPMAEVLALCAREKTVTLAGLGNAGRPPAHCRAADPSARCCSGRPGPAPAASAYMEPALFLDEGPAAGKRAAADAARRPAAGDCSGPGRPGNGHCHAGGHLKVMFGEMRL